MCDVCRNSIVRVIATSETAAMIEQATDDGCVITIADMPPLGGFATKIRHRIVQHPENDRAVFPCETLLQGCEPAAHRLK